MFIGRTIKSSMFIELFNYPVNNTLTNIHNNYQFILGNKLIYSEVICFKVNIKVQRSRFVLIWDNIIIFLLGTWCFQFLLHGVLCFQCLVHGVRCLVAYMVFGVFGAS